MIISLDGLSHYGQTISHMLDGSFAYVEIDLTNTGGDEQEGYQITTPSWDTSATLALRANTHHSNLVCRRVLPATKTALLTKFRYAQDSLMSVNGLIDIFDWRDGSNTVICKLSVNNDGSLSLKKSDNTVLGTTQGPVQTTQNWLFYEMKLDVSANTFELHVNDSTGTGTPVLNLTGLSISSGPISQYSLIPLPGAFPADTHTPFCWMKDVFISDTSGSVNNGFQGDFSVATDFVDADVTVPWTPRYRHNIGTGILDVTPANSCVSAATAASLNVGAGDYTLETFARLEVLPGATSKFVFFSRWDETNNQRSYQLYLGSVGLNGGNLVFQTSTDGNGGTVLQPISYPWSPETNRWYHIAIVRASSELLLFIDGVQLGLPIADARTYFAGSAPFGLGAQVEGASTVPNFTGMVGWLDEFRFTVGFARYTTAFTPTTVPFPRGAGSDPQWADVAMLCGFDSLIQDESSFARAVTSRNGAFQETPADGPAVGAFSTLNKPIPADDTFIEAPLIAATSVLTLNAQPAANNTVTVGTKSGGSAAVYTFKAAVASAYDVLIDTTLAGTLQNLFNAINAGAGSGTKYGTGTAANVDVTASQLPAGQMLVTANTPGTAGNSVATSVSLTNGGAWTGATLAGGAAIPAASDFKVTRPPPDTTIIAGVVILQRSSKTDAGTCSVQVGLVGPLGAATLAAAHPMTLTPGYYGDVFETDPDTAGPITPTTLINGRVRINRTA